MKWALLLNFVLITLVAGDGAWKQNKEYKYKVLIKSLTASSKLNNRWVGTVLRARLSINPQSKNLLIGKLDDAESAEIELSGTWDANFNADELSYQKSLLKPFRIHLENGVIHSLSVDRTMTNDQKIQLKAIVSQLQVDTNKVDGDGNNAFYKTTEQTVTGNCGTTYDISPVYDRLVKYNSGLIPLPELKGEGDFINVVKTRDHNNCTERYGFVNRRNVYPMENNVIHSEASRILVSGSIKDYTIQSSVTTNKVTYNELFTTIHYVNLMLESMEENTSRFTSRPQIQVENNLKVEKLSFYNDVEKTEETLRSNEKISKSNEQIQKDDADWSSCYTWFVGAEEMCRQSFNAEYAAESTENCGFLGLGHRVWCVKKFPGCRATVCWAAAVSGICEKEFQDSLPVSQGTVYTDCSPGFRRLRCCPK